MIRATDLAILQPTGKTLYWSRLPGKFVSKFSGDEIKSPISFPGRTFEWFEILSEIIHEASEELSSKKATHIAVSPDVLSIIECSPSFKPALTQNDDKDFFEDGTFSGTLRNRWDVYKCMDLPMDIVVIVNEEDLTEEPTFVKIVDMSIL